MATIVSPRPLHLQTSYRELFFWAFLPRNSIFYSFICLVCLLLPLHLSRQSSLLFFLILCLWEYYRFIRVTCPRSSDKRYCRVVTMSLLKASWPEVIWMCFHSILYLSHLLLLVYPLQKPQTLILCLYGVSHLFGSVSFSKLVPFLFLFPGGLLTWLELSRFCA